mgnify:FL=1|jgi:protein arginine kinase activator
MLCEICGENEATFHYSEVVNGNKTEHHLCSECAAKTDISYYTNLLDGEGRLGQLLSGLLGMPIGGEQDDPKTHVVCPGCHLSYGEFIKNSAFGCAECYNVFGPLLDESIKKIQGSVNHQGKKPYRLMKSMRSTNAENMPENEASVIAEAEDGIADSTKQEKKPTRASLEHEIDVADKRLKQAVLEEDFEEAARLRDYIKDLRGQIERLDENA